MATDTAAASKGKGKKKGTKFTPLPGVQAAGSVIPWHIEYTSRVGRHAVADKDLPAGTLVYIEEPFLVTPMTKFSAAVCHRCLRALLENGEVPKPGNPCLPRYCEKCKELPKPLDAKLAPLRIKLHEIATQNQIDPVMLHIITMLDLKRSGLEIGNLSMADQTPIPSHVDASSRPLVRCSVEDFDSLTNVWDRKPETWRKKLAPAVRALHKELTSLAESDFGTSEKYSPSPLVRLQADAACMSPQINSLTGPNATTETGVGIFPGLSVFQHSCAPNCFSIVLGSRAYVRTVQDIPSGTALTVSYTTLTDPRSARQAQLEQERHITCACSRCVTPINDSPDRFLDGIICPYCQTNVMQPLPEGPENESALAKYKERLVKDIELMNKAAARRAIKTGAKGGKKGEVKKGDAPDGNKSNDTDSPENGHGKGEETDEAEKKDHVEEVDAADDDPTQVPEGVMFWQCCSNDCQWVEPAHNVQGTGPADATSQAERLYHQAMTFLTVKHPEFIAQGETFLEQIQQGLEGRLSMYHHRVIDAASPLIHINMRKGEALKVLNLALTQWDVDKALNEGRPTMQQLQCLEAIVEAAEAKASNAHSSVIKRQLEKKVKMAIEELKRTRKVLLGN